LIKVRLGKKAPPEPYPPPLEKQAGRKKSVKEINTVIENNFRTERDDQQ